MPVDAEQFAGFSGHGIAAHRLAGLSTAQFQHMPARRMIAVIVIECDNTMHLGARYVQRLGNQRQSLLRHIAELALQLVQNRKERTFLALQLIDNVYRSPSDIGTCGLHFVQRPP